MSPPVCAHCGEPINPRGPLWREVIGWEQARAQGGTNHIAKRERTGRLMHEACMHVARGDGPLPGQTTIDDFV